MEGESVSSSITINQREKKRTKGRRKIEMKRIEKKNNLNVTFSKRRKGLFKKAKHLCKLCGVKMAILLLSPVGKPYAWGYPSHKPVIDCFLLDHSSNWINYDERVQEVEAKLEQENEKAWFRWVWTANEDPSIGLQGNVAGLPQGTLEGEDVEDARWREACTRDFLSGFGL